MNELPTLSTKGLLILKLINENKDGLYGLELVRKSKNKLTEKSIYIILKRIEDKGYINSKIIFDRHSINNSKRRVYKLTKLGVRIYKTFERLKEILKNEK